MHHFVIVFQNSAVLALLLSIFLVHFISVTANYLPFSRIIITQNPGSKATEYGTIMYFFLAAKAL
jgi:hypothetical protein